MLRPNPLLKKIAAKEPIIMAFVPLASPVIAEMICMGCDGIVLEAEHSTISEAEADAMIRAADGVGKVAITRVPSIDATDYTRRVLESGTMGILMPHCKNPAIAKRLVDSIWFEPEGHRGATPYSRANGYNTIPRDEFIAMTKSEVMAIAMIEDPEGVDNIDEIISVPGISAAFIGRGDLSTSMRTSQKDPKLLAMIDKVIDVCKKRNKPFFLAGGGDDAVYWIKERGAAGMVGNLGGFVPDAWRKSADYIYNGVKK